MGAKKTLPAYDLFNAKAVTGTNTYTTDTSTVANFDNIGLQVSFVGTMAGTLTIEVSNDDENYDALTFSPALTQPAGGDVKYAVNLKQLPWQYMHVKYVNATGSGTLTVSIFAKDLN